MSDTCFKTYYQIDGSPDRIKDLSEKLFTTTDEGVQFVFHNVVEIPESLLVRSTERATMMLEYITTLSSIVDIDPQKLLSLPDISLIKIMWSNNEQSSDLLNQFKLIDEDLSVFTTLVEDTHSKSFDSLLRQIKLSTDDELKSMSKESELSLSDILIKIDQDDYSLLETYLTNEMVYGYYGIEDYSIINIGCMPVAAHCEQEITENSIKGSFYTMNSPPFEFFSKLKNVSISLRALDVESGNYADVELNTRYPEKDKLGEY